MSTLQNPFASSDSTQKIPVVRALWPIKPTVALLIISGAFLAWCAFIVSSFEIRTADVPTHDGCQVEYFPYFLETDAKIQSAAIMKYMACLAQARRIREMRGLTWLVCFPLILQHTIYLFALMRKLRGANREHSMRWLYIFVVPLLSPGLFLGIPFAIWALVSVSRGERSSRKN